MIKNSGLGQLAEAAAGEEFYPVRRRGEKRRLNPNRAAIEWLEADTFSMTDEYSRFLMTDTGGRYGAGRGEIDGTVLVTKAFGATLGSHHSRPMFECFDHAMVNGLTSESPCGNCDNYAYSWAGCPDHAIDGRALTPPGERPAAPSERTVTLEYQLALYANTHRITWRVSPS